MEQYRYTADSKTKYLTMIHFIVFIAIAAALCIWFDGGYMLAWFISIVIAIIALMVLSIPRYIVLSDEGLEIQCISDYTFIPYDQILSIKKVDNSSLNFIIPIFAAYGFFGYYGCYLDLKCMDFVKLYALKWGNFIEITDIYEDKYYISCDNECELVERVLGRKSPKPNKDE